MLRGGFLPCGFFALQQHPGAGHKTPGAAEGWLQWTSAALPCHLVSHLQHKQANRCLGKAVPLCNETPEITGR